MDMAVGDTRTPIRITAMATIPAMRTRMVLIGEAPGGGIGGAGTSQARENDQGQDEIEKFAREASDRTRVPRDLSIV
jgi:hypothetical protein